MVPLQGTSQQHWGSLGSLANTILAAPFTCPLLNSDQHQIHCFELDGASCIINIYPFPFAHFREHFYLLLAWLGTMKLNKVGLEETTSITPSLRPTKLIMEQQACKLQLPGFESLAYLKEVHCSCQHGRVCMCLLICAEIHFKAYIVLRRPIATIMRISKFHIMQLPALMFKESTFYLLQKVVAMLSLKDRSNKRLVLVQQHLMPILLKNIYYIEECAKFLHLSLM